MNFLDIVHSLNLLYKNFSFKFRLCNIRRLYMSMFNFIENIALIKYIKNVRDKQTTNKQSNKYKH